MALVSCPGYGVLDSGCGSTIIRECTLSEFEKLWQQQDIRHPVFSSETHQFKYGELETSNTVVAMPVSLAGRRGVIKASVVRGHAPLLILRSALKHLAFGSDLLPLQVNQAGQYVVNLMENLHDPKCEHFAEVISIEKPDRVRPDDASPDAAPTDAAVLPEHRVHPEPDQPDADRVPANEDSPHSVWFQEDSGVNAATKLSKRGPKWQRVFRRVLEDANTGQVLSDHHFSPGTLQSRTICPFLTGPAACSL